MKSNSFAHGNSQSGNSAYNGITTPATRNPYLGDERLGGEHWWYLA